MAAPTLVFDPARRELLPAPLAFRARLLAEETQRHGVQTTPDELSNLIEATFDHLFRLWVAEFAHAGAPDPALARELVSTLGSKLLLGHRVRLASCLREVFVRRRIATVFEGLAMLDFGQPDDASHAVARLLAFRNGFAHGGFAASVHAIESHRALIEGILEGLPALFDQPVQAVCESGELIAFRGLVDRVPLETVVPISTLQPFIMGRTDSSRLDLFPLWRAGRSEDQEWTLLPPDPERTGHNLDAFFEREAMRDYALRWRDERDGIINHRALVESRAWRPLETAERDALRDAVASVQLVLVEAHPGCGKAAAIASILDGGILAAGRFADISCIVLDPNEAAESAQRFAAVVARAVERALGLPPRGLLAAEGARAGGTKIRSREISPLALAQIAARQLASSGMRVLIAIEDAHVTAKPPFGQTTLTIASVVRALAGSSVHIVATSHAGAFAAPFAHDRKVILAVPSAPRADRLQAALDASLSGRLLHLRTLRAVAASSTPRTLFEICDALDSSNAADAEAVFEPAVERALADLRPVLVTGRERAGAERLWRIFHPAVREALRARES